MVKKDIPKQDDKVVTRVKATDTKATKKAPKKAIVTEAKVSQPSEKKPLPNPLKATGGYFVGAWRELQQVRWPNRRATWSLTAAMLVFTAFFVVLILLLDALFKYVFQLILG